jgi:GntR family transcriptional regulator/MocR family aminotransferase
MVPSFVAARAMADRHPPTLEQATLAAFVAEGHFERHLARMRRLYAQRRAALLRALAAELPGIARHDPATTAAGLHLLVGFDLPLTERELVARAAAAGVRLEPAGPCYALDPPPLPSALLGYASLPEDRIRAGIRRLAEGLRTED